MEAAEPKPRRPWLLLALQDCDVVRLDGGNAPSSRNLVLDLTILAVHHDFERDAGNGVGNHDHVFSKLQRPAIVVHRHSRRTSDELESRTGEADVRRVAVTHGESIAGTNRD